MKKRIQLLVVHFTCLVSTAFSLGEGYEPIEFATTLQTPSAVEPAKEEPFTPWFTGPLLTPSGHVVPLGYIDVEPYFFYTVTTGSYNADWNSVSSPNFTVANFQFPLFIGITSWSNILLVPQTSWNNTEGVSSLQFNDFILEFDFQLIHDTQENKIPGLKFYIQEVFPAGHFQNRDPAALGTDIGGSGSFRSSVGFVLTQTVKVLNKHYFAYRVNPFLSFPSRVGVRGVNAYGGTPNTDARVRPGIVFGGLLGLEYNLTQNWVLACDLQVVYSNKTKFSGFPGTNPDGTLADLSSPSSIQFTLAPAIEYNFSEAFGFILGPWFSFAGRNSSKFISGVIAFNYYGPLPWGPKHRYRTAGGSSSSSGGEGGHGHGGTGF